MKHKRCQICNGQVYAVCDFHGVWKSECKCNSTVTYYCSLNQSHDIDKLRESVRECKK